VSSVTAVIRQPNSTAWWFQVPADSMATGTTDVAVGQLPVFGLLVACRLVSCRPCCGHRVSEVGVGIGVWYCDISCLWFAFCPWHHHLDARRRQDSDLQVLSQLEPELS